MVKSPTTFKQQMDILKSRNIIIIDEDFCLNILSHLNYYRFTAYMLPFKVKDDEYLPVTFERIYNIYEFDRKLRALLLSVLEEIELLLRTILAFYHGHEYGALGYLNEKNFYKMHRPDKFIEEFEKLVNKNKDSLFVRHHIKNKNREFPIWVAVELLPFGMLSRFYDDMHTKGKKIIASIFEVGYKQLESWLLCLSTLRNRCAHYMRLYFYTFNKWPKPPENSNVTLANYIFDFIYVMKYCYLDSNDKWGVSFFVPLCALIEEYEQYIDLGHIGFPCDWKEKLEK